MYARKEIKLGGMFMKKVYGIQSGMVMQRDSDTNMCSITLTIENAIDPVASMGRLT